MSRPADWHIPIYARHARFEALFRYGEKVVELIGLEPTASTVRLSRSTN